PPGAADLPGRDGADDVERPIKDKQQPNHRGQRPEGIDRVGERPDRAHQEQDPSRTCAHRQPTWTEASRNSLNMAARKTTPMRTPTVVIEVSRNRSTTTEMISHAIPVISISHHGPASRHRPARALRRR